MTSRAKKLVVGIASLVVLLLVLWAAKFVYIQSQYQNTPGEILACLNEGGQWKEFGNTCADTCSSFRSDGSKKLCGQAFTYSCQCGQDECWDEENSECIKNPWSE